MREPGEVVVLREVWHGRIFEARPANVVLDRQDVTAFFLPTGISIRSAVGPDGQQTRMPFGEWRLAERRRGHRRVLSFAWPQVAYAVLLFWHPDDRFGGWYVNLQTPLARTALGFDYTDHFLDVVVAHDRSWRWKDEDELALAFDRGMLTPVEMDAIRAAGENAIEHLERRVEPFDDTWLDWKPDPGWPLPELPPGWDAAP